MIKFWTDRDRIDIFCYFPDCDAGEEASILLYEHWGWGPPCLIHDNKVGLIEVNDIRINMDSLAKGFTI